MTTLTDFCIAIDKAESVDAAVHIDKEIQRLGRTLSLVELRFLVEHKKQKWDLLRARRVAFLPTPQQP